MKMLDKKRRWLTDMFAENRFKRKSDAALADQILEKFFPQGTDDTDGFLRYIHEQREEFAKIALTYPVDDHPELRTKIDDLIIAYDQMTTRIRDYELNKSKP